jgi:hypothetical protein
MHVKQASKQCSADVSWLWAASCCQGTTGRLFVFSRQMQRRGLTSQTYPACAHVPLPTSCTGNPSTSMPRCCMRLLLSSVGLAVPGCISRSWHAAGGLAPPEGTRLCQNDIQRIIINCITVGSLALHYWRVQPRQLIDAAEQHNRRRPGMVYERRGYTMTPKYISQTNICRANSHLR